MRSATIISLLSVFIFAETTAQNDVHSNYDLTIKEWHKERDDKLKVANGWLTLAGLFWLEEGENKIGSSPENNVRLPDQAPEHWGTILLENEETTFISKISESNLDNNTDLAMPLTYSGNRPTVICHQSLQWHLLKRGTKIGLRLRDTLHPNRFNFDSVPYYDIDPSWNIKTEFIASKQEDSMRINNVLGMEFNRHPAGYIDISRNGQTHRLSLIDTGNEYFLIFSDATTGDKTYGGGRYLYIEKPTTGQELQVDFNKAENPPCVFTKFATCLLPPIENKISFRVEAGELYEGH